MRPIRKFLAHALAATVLAAFAATGAAAADMFLKLGDIKGEAAKELHGGQIPIASWSWGATRKGWDGTIKGPPSAEKFGAVGGMHRDADAAMPDPNPQGLAVSDPGAPGPKTTSKRQHGWNTVSKPLDRGSVTVKGSLPGCTVGAQYPDAVLQTAAARYELKEVIITSCAMPSMSGSAGGGQSLPTESVSLNYEKIKYVYVPASKQDPKSQVRGWDPDKKE